MTHSVYKWAQKNFPRRVYKELKKINRAENLILNQDRCCTGLNISFSWQVDKMGKANENKLSSTKLLNEFFKAFVELFEEEINILYVKTSNYFNSATKGILKDVPHVEVQKINNAGSNKFDILIGDFAFGASRFRKELPSEIIETLKSLISISSSGFGFFIFPSYERTFRYYDLNTHLKCEGFF